MADVVERNRGPDPLDGVLIFHPDAVELFPRQNGRLGAVFGAGVAGLFLEPLDCLSKQAAVDVVGVTGMGARDPLVPSVDEPAFVFKSEGLPPRGGCGVNKRETPASLGRVRVGSSVSQGTN